MERPKVLLLGNGINRSFGCEKWNELLDEMSCTSFSEEETILINNLAFPLQAIVVTEDNVDEGIALISSKLIEEDVKEKQAEILKDLAGIGFDSILTTNYTYDVEKALDSSFSCKKGKPSKYRKNTKKGNRAEDQFGIFKFMEVNGQRIWHIHGEAALEKSIVLGHYYYGKLLAVIQNHISDLIVRYKMAKKNGRDFVPQSWIDYFMTGDVYIVGLGLDVSEMDLWWLINCKKRYNKELGGKLVWFEPNLLHQKNYEKRVLATVNDIDYKTEKVEDFGKYYEGVAEKVKIEKDR